MADLGSITAVRPTSNTQHRLVDYGATIAAGNSVCFDPTDSKWKLADNNDTTTTAGLYGLGVAMTPGVDGGQGFVAVGGSIILVGTTMSVGEYYVVSATAGGVAPATDLATNNRVSNLGVAASATQLDLSVKYTGILHV